MGDQRAGLRRAPVSRNPLKGRSDIDPVTLLERLQGVCSDRSRLMFWPIRFGWFRRSHKFFTWHGWHATYEAAPWRKHAVGCCPGVRPVYGWTLHVGAFKVYFGKAVPWSVGESRLFMRQRWLDLVAEGHPECQRLVDVVTRDILEDSQINSGGGSA